MTKNTKNLQSPISNPLRKISRDCRHLGVSASIISGIRIVEGLQRIVGLQISLLTLKKVNKLNGK